MLRNIGVIPYKNNNERKVLFKQLRDEFGQDCKIWAENYLLFYQYKVTPDTIYL
jgi:hypothetical protein